MSGVSSKPKRLAITKFGRASSDTIEHLLRRAPLTSENTRAFVAALRSAWRSDPETAHIYEFEMSRRVLGSVAASRSVGKDMGTLCWCLLFTEWGAEDAGIPNLWPPWE